MYIAFFQRLGNGGLYVCVGFIGHAIANFHQFERQIAPHQRRPAQARYLDKRCFTDDLNDFLQPSVVEQRTGLLQRQLFFAIQFAGNHFQRIITGNRTVQVQRRGIRFLPAGTVFAN
ncbi:Uncharacterised protein [Shigella sonnei]|nr:Uncharacterised protein [Shigella sonnei]